jgi:hypothetical protein
MLCQAYMGLPTVQAQEQTSATSIIDLPSPVIDGSMSIEKALSERRTVRSYSDKPLSLEDISQILWAAQGITEPKRGLRTAPSAQASYLMKVYVLTGKVADLTMGMYQYQPQGHKLVKIADGDIKTDLYSCCRYYWYIQQGKESFLDISGSGSYCTEYLFRGCIPKSRNGDDGRFQTRGSKESFEAA